MNDQIKIIAAIIAVAQALYFPAKEALYIAALVTAITLLILKLKAIRDDNLWWGNVVDPIWVVDWATFGDRIIHHIPFDLRDHIIVAPARKVLATTEWAKKRLIDRKNFLYLEKDEKKRLTVNYRFFRKGKFVNQTDDEYIQMLIEDMRAVKLAWHTRWDEAPETLLKEGMGLSYHDVFLATHRNHSLN